MPSGLKLLEHRKQVRFVLLHHAGDIRLSELWEFMLEQSVHVSHIASLRLFLCVVECGCRLGKFGQELLQWQQQPQQQKVQKPKLVKPTSKNCLLA
jgi:hypothetical protein